MTVDHVDEQGVVVRADGSRGEAAAEALRYDYEIDVDSESTQAKVVRLVGTNKRVLEVGCATGYMSRVLRDHGCQVVGIEIDSKAAARASAFCERVIVGDVEQMDLARELGEDRFDVVVAADVLEHLKDPLPILRAVKGYLRADGYIVASIPNIGHGSVRLALLGGLFPYSELGLLDRTHLRFYTRDSIKKLFEDAECVIEHLERQEKRIEDSEVPYDREAVPPGLVETLSQDPEALTYQFIVMAYPLRRIDLGFIRRRILELVDENAGQDRVRKFSELRQAVEELAAALRQFAEEKDAAERELAQLRQALAQQTEHLDALGTLIESKLSREAELQAMLLDAHDQLLQRDEELQERRAAWAEQREAVISELQRQLESAERTIAGMRASRAWRLATRYWKVRSRFGSRPTAPDR